MNILPDRDTMALFDSIKDPKEELLWTGKPKFIPYMCTGLGVSLFTIFFGLIWIIGVRHATGEDGKGVSPYFCLFGFLPLLQGLYLFVKKLLFFSNTAYTFSSKRVMIRTGFIAISYKIIDFDKISDTEVKVNMVEKLYDVGTIRFFSGRTQTDEGNTTKIYDSWIAIPEPHAVYKMTRQTKR